jgi:FKBP-type peptidyl-prolyl cis-trans isomerase
MPVVEAVGVSANLSATGTQFPMLGKKAAQMIEQAMSSAVEECYKQGITEPEAVREAMQNARALMKSDLAKIEADMIRKYQDEQAEAAAKAHAHVQQVLAEQAAQASSEETQPGNPEG